LHAYGGAYHDDAITLALTPCSGTRIPLNNAMDLLNVLHGTNVLTITQSGTYEVTFSVSLTSCTNTNISVSVRKQSTSIPSLIVTHSLAENENSSFFAQAIITLNANDVLDLAISALQEASISLGCGVNASLIVKQVNM